uniref:Uncharacterized protein n=1 Tax=Marseillevirus LCMAC201 TaxID=2506605 RepID=A0A481YY02_9VIRU|nr:MAG: hypothetical protein LCMAC201_03340 [Marseillevirus LCMAC201]
MNQVNQSNSDTQPKYYVECSDSEKQGTVNQTPVKLCTELTVYSLSIEHSIGRSYSDTTFFGTFISKQLLLNYLRKLVIQELHEYLENLEDPSERDYFHENEKEEYWQRVEKVFDEVETTGVGTDDDWYGCYFGQTFEIRVDKSTVSMDHPQN